MRLHNLTRALAILGVIAIGLRWLQVYPGRNSTPHWIAVIPESLTLLFVLAAMLLAPVLLLTEFALSRPRPAGKPLYIDGVLVAITYLCFLLYIRWA